MGHWDRTREAGPLTVQVEQAGDALMVRATGDLIRSTAPTFEAELRMVICGGASTVDLDLGGVGLIDSTGLQSMIRAGNHTLRRGGRLRMRHASTSVRRAIERGGCQQLLPLV